MATMEASEEYIKIRNYNYVKIYHQYWNNRLIRLLPKQNDIRILDLGCASGILTESLIKSGYENVVGIDINKNLIYSSPENIQKYLEVGNGRKTRFQNDEFDAIISRGAIHHIEEDKVFIELRRILKNGGLLIMNEPCDDFFLFRLVRRKVYKKSPDFKEYHKTYLTSEVKKLYGKQGFSLIKYQKLGYGAHVLGELARFFPMLKYLPFNITIMTILIYADNLLFKIPLLRNTSVMFIAVGKKISQPHDEWKK